MLDSLMYNSREFPVLESLAPIYEYRCGDDGRKQTILVRSFTSADDPVCERCGSGNLRKLVSRFAVVRSEENRIEDVSDLSAVADLDEHDPRGLARWARRMG